MKNLSVRGIIGKHTLVNYSVEPVIAKLIEVNLHEVTIVVRCCFEDEQIPAKRPDKLDNALPTKTYSTSGQLLRINSAISGLIKTVNYQKTLPR